MNTNPYKAILRNANAGYWDLDFSNYKFELSDVLKRIFEWPDLQINSFEDWLTIVHLDDRNRIAALLKDVVSSKGQITFEGECKFQRENGHLFWGEFCGEIIEWTDDNLPARFVGCIFDITLRRQSEAALVLSEERFKGAFENSSVAMAIIDLDGKWLRNNKRMAELFGYTSEELSQLRYQDLTYPDDLEADLLLVNATLEGMIDSYQVEKRYFHKSENIVHGLLSVSLVRDQLGKPVHFITQIQDVTAFKKSQEELYQTSKRLEAILFAGKDVSIIATDLNGIITIFSPGAEELTGYRANEVVGIHSPLILHKKEELNILSQKLTARAAQSYSGFEIFKGILKYFSNTTMQWTYVKKNGEAIPVQLTVSEVKNNDGLVYGYIGVAVDISVIQRAKDDLRRSEQRWQFALEGSENGVWDWDVVNNTIFFSRKWKEIIGYNDDEIGSSTFEWEGRIHPEDLDGFYNALKLHVSGERAFFETEHRLKDKLGNYKWVVSKGKVIEFISENKPKRIIGTTVNITLQKETMNQLIRTLDLAAEQNKRLLSFAHIISHNLRSHSGNFELLFSLLDISSTEKDRGDILAQIRMVTGKLADTIANLNEVVSIQSNSSINKKTIKLKEVLESITLLLKGQINSSKAIIEFNFEDDFVVDFNPAYLESTFLNLLSNCIKYRSHDRFLHIIVTAIKVKEGIEILVQDNGVGLDLDKHGDRVFGLYKTFHGNADARGLGLFMTKNQVEAMGGKISIESEVSIGTTIKIVVP